MSKFIVTHKAAGQVVQPGDQITDFRGGTYRLDYATRANQDDEFGMRDGKVMVKDVQGERYASVFGLHVDPA